MSLEQREEVEVGKIAIERGEIEWGGSVIVWNASRCFAVAELRLNSARGQGGIDLVVELGYLYRCRARN